MWWKLKVCVRGGALEVSDGPGWGISGAGMTDGGKERDRHEKRKEMEGET